eukprot:TRINITY_DN2696_c0_g1_i5.p1 TRINITY_DN2696_c0_g1~~TRINITY_DN2696_c0_g1_i5.p1  ORF type:complete len:1420 (+),score=325.81 TRINITY_DN2696_c0_g1_i5:55-4314(+)
MSTKYTIELDNVVLHLELDPEATVGALLELVSKSVETGPKPTQIKLKQSDAILDLDDTLQDVVEDPSTEILVAVVSPSDEIESLFPPELKPSVKSTTTSTLLFNPSTEVIKLRYRCVYHNTPQELSVPLSTTFEELRDLIAKSENAKISNKQVVTDLHLSSHPLLTTAESLKYTIAEWGFGHLFSPEKELSDENVIYVSFRYYEGDKPKITTKPISDRFCLTPAWQPWQEKQSQQGICSYLSALYVLSASLTDEEKKSFYNQFMKLVYFPPAVLAFCYLSKKKNIQDEQKAALSSAFYQFCDQFLKQVPDIEKSAGKIFERSLVCLAYLISYGPKPEKDAIEFTDISLTDPLTYTRIVDPVTVKQHSEKEGETRKIYNRQALLDRMEGGKMHIKGSPWEKLSNDDLIPHAPTKILLLAHPLSEEIIVISAVHVKYASKESEEEVLEFEWGKLTRKLLNQVKCLRLVPSLALNRSKSPSLTKGSNGQVNVYTGPEPCSVGTVILYDPLSGESKGVNPNILAKSLNDPSGMEFMADDREVLEAIMVCLDVSSSMNGDAWDDDKDESSGITFTKEELDIELKRFREHPHLDFYRTMYQGSSAKNMVIGEVKSQSLVLAQLCDKYPQKILEILAEKPTKTFADDTEDEESEDKESDIVPEPKNPMQLFIKTLNGQTITIMADKDWTIATFKKAIQKKRTSGFTSTDIRLIFAGKQLQDNLTLKDFNIHQEATIHLLLRLGSAPEMGKRKITLKDRIFRTKFEITVDTSITVYELKLKLWKRNSYDVPYTFSLWSNMREIGDGWVTGTLFRDDEKLYRHNLNDLIEMRSPHRNADNRLTRIQTVQQLFNVFINRSQAYDYPNQIGLILFGNDVNVTCPITPLFEVFRDHIDSSDAKGETKLWDAIKTAGETLVQFSQKHPKAKLRVLCLSDGEDTKSKSEAWEVAQFLQKNNIICDCIMIGEGANNKELRQVAKAAGGYAFAPQNLKQALKLNELETLLTIHERPPLYSRPLVSSRASLTKFSDLWLYPLDECTDERVPKRRVPEGLKKPVQSVEKTLEKASTDDNASKPKGSVGRSRRILKELTQILKDPHPAIDIYPSQSDIGFWRMIMEAPEGSPYKSGTWLLYANFPEDYPLSAPEIRFVTPIRHCNVNQYGKICHSIFTRNWTADTTMTVVLGCIYGLLLNPDVDDPLDTGLALQYFAASGQYEALIMDHVQKHATSTSREEWKKELLEEDEAEDQTDTGAQEAPAQTTPTPKWFYDGESGWVKYSKKDSDKIEAAFQSQQPTVTILDGVYQINIPLRTQIKLSTKFERKVLRGTWFWRENNGTYYPFAEESAEKLEQSFLKQIFNVEIETDKLRQCVIYEDGTGKQFRTNAWSNGRSIIRGYRGRTLVDSFPPSKKRKVEEEKPKVLISSDIPAKGSN